MKPLNIHELTRTEQLLHEADVRWSSVYTLMRVVGPGLMLEL